MDPLTEIMPEDSPEEVGSAKASFVARSIEGDGSIEGSDGVITISHKRFDWGSLRPFNASYGEGGLGFLARLETNVPQSTSVTDPGSHASSASSILATFGLMDGQ